MAVKTKAENRKAALPYEAFLCSNGENVTQAKTPFVEGFEKVSATMRRIDVW